METRYPPLLLTDGGEEPPRSSTLPTPAQIARDESRLHSPLP